MKKRSIALVLVISCVLAGCGKNVASTPVEDTEAVVESETVDELVTVDEAVQEEDIDINNLPNEVSSAFLLMDAFNQYLYSENAKYDANDPVSVWNVVTYAAGESVWDECGIEYVDDSPYISVPTEYVQSLISGSFAGKNDIPEIPEEMQDKTGEGYDQIVKNDEAHYYIGAGDRGLSQSKVIGCKHLSNNTYVVTVELDSVEEEVSEICAFTYILTENKENTLFPYAISSVEPGDDLTKKRLDGCPYLTKDVYYGSTYDANDMTIHECFGFYKIPYTDTIYKLNCKISEDLSKYDANDDGEWQEIRSYPFESEKYLQVVMTAITYPNYATYGEAYSYNYDIINDKTISLDDAYNMLGTTEEDICSNIEKQVATVAFAGEKFDKAEIEAFRIKPDDSMDFYVKIYFKSDNAEDNNRLFTFDYMTNELKPYDNYVLILDGTDDMIDMGLTHGIAQ